MSERRPPPRADGHGEANLRRFGTAPRRFLETIQGAHDGPVEVAAPEGRRLVVVTDPGTCHAVLSRREAFRRLPAIGAASLVAENGLTQSEGARWERQRDVVVPGLDRGARRTFVETVSRRTAAWCADRRPGERVADLHREVAAITIGAATESLFGVDLGPERARRVHGWAATLARESELSPETLDPSVEGTPTACTRRAAEHLADLCDDLIERRRTGSGCQPADGRGAVLGRLLAAERDPSVDCPPEQVRDEVFALLMAGHESLSVATTCALALLSWHPDAAARVREAALDDPAAEPADEASSLEHVDRVVVETLRLYPPVWTTYRRATYDVALGDHRLPAGTVAILPQWSIQRDASRFDDPTRFAPDRWRERSVDATPAWFPFGSGPHACVGRGFALRGARALLATLLDEFDPDVPDSALLDLRPSPILRPRGGVPATLRDVG